MSSNDRIVVTRMNVRERREWTAAEPKKRQNRSKRLLKSPALYAVAVLCLCGGVLLAAGRDGDAGVAVMSHLSAGFEYDESLGRLQFVSNILPESAMVFMSSPSDTQTVAKPVQAESVTHDWTQEEPWLEYDCSGEISACMDGEIMTIVKNRADEYTVRVLHENGYESIYSGLNEVFVQENASVLSGESMGWSEGAAAFELRCDGLSVLPVFSENDG